VSRWSLGITLFAILVASLVLGVRFDSVPLTTSEMLAVLGGGGEEWQREIVWQFRFPRALLGALVGGGLALAGATFQALLRNPLAEPYILGISGGASVGAVTLLALGLATATSWALPLAAFAGALLAIALVFRVATASGRTMDVRVLLLAGVVIGAFFSACIAFILSVSEARTVQSAVLWIMGSLAGAAWRDVIVTAVYTIPAALLLLGLARPLNLISVGEETALYLGADVERVKRLALLLVGSDHRALLPLSFLGGAAFLSLADLIAKLALSPTEIPVGVITAFVGVPLFLILLRRSVAS
jgi:iron complex transport system permease protein